MPTPTPPPANNQLVAEQIYDLLMAEIEPELLLANIPVLDAKYAAETPEEHAVRMARYAQAYKKFDDALKTFKEDVNGRVKTAKRTSLKVAEAEGKAQEEAKLHAIDRTLRAG
jgi:hypothetical protein